MLQGERQCELHGIRAIRLDSELLKQCLYSLLIRIG